MVKNAETIYMLLSPEVLQVLPTFTNIPIRFRKREKERKLLLYVDQSRAIFFAVRTFDSSSCCFKHVSSYRVFSKLL